ncbi:ornithine carbamoyltransferase [Desulfovibrio legallii]|jgi:ornithine carbamoyltransferase|uniref:Ornithine carbamoyltransferase n=1 Tax=Desulfovibrio legallii TaxID=571438 RepID=A0A1G7KIM9_9BACT|nr:ornithine carbamoyltransferase [Desulfovibrio legallii]SDF36894.1 Ornithine carbamoyltransferase [Desulfovibrio legallii]
MARHILTIKDLGETACWLLVQQALGMPDPKLQTDFMTQRVALLVFAQHSLPERLCVSAAVRQMGGSVVYEGNRGIWRSEMDDYREQLLPIFSYYLDCMYVYGLPVRGWEMETTHLRFPLINAGSPDAHPAHTLADISCMLLCSRYLDTLTCAWLGCVNGTLHSLIEASAWFPFRLRVALPAQVDRRPLEEAVARLGTEVIFVDSPEEAVKGANYVFAGCRSGLTAEERAVWRVDARLMALAEPNARLLLSASPVSAIGVADEILASKASLLVQQAEYRLRVHKRMLHWVFLDNEREL